MAVLGVGAASAQTAAMQRALDRGGDHAGSSATRIQANLQLQMPIQNGDSLEAQTKAGETLRRALYTMADHECALIGDVFKASCRLVSAHVTSSYQERGASGPTLRGNVSATFEVTKSGG
jgi:hypothetical protein